ncbi:uncharacterized protein HMPREF1541_03788 [Cyphellophora europaea CBS 101466]|uniref:C3H1-type domain-containing protein n=1 Tax=Cyphellophora europaea (strain CBS 101466) TaxID=1220924 RepID=W2S1L4_CYPE1|nr:uncharacterized protein HMPREF1541_03788 [Cyphellophora europaea CBS 101466]ETN41849.1 hypothetical protein HMPREF1541_03788 [Cyphellophora europaea CBS 101466]
MARYDPFSPTFEHPLLNSSPDYGARSQPFRNGPIGALLTQTSYRERHKRLKDQDLEKNQLIEDLLYQLETTQNELRSLQLDQNRESQFNRDIQLREDSLQNQLRQTKEIMDRNAFVTALIDGDGMLFTKDLLSRGEKGGKEAATLLQAALTDFVSTDLGHLDSVRITVRIYADISTLSENLTKCKEIDKPSVLHDFIHGFNNNKLLFDFVDVGTRNDAAGDKISENMRLSLYDCHCHAVLLGCSLNNDYARIIDRVAQDTEVANHLVLLEGAPFEKEIADLQPGFKIVRFDNVFRSTKLSPPKTVTNVTLPVLARVESNKTSGNNSASSTPQMNWATVTAQAHTNPTNGSNGTNNSPAAVTTKPVKQSTPATSVNGDTRSKGQNKSISTNRQGQRIDRTDEAIPNYEIQRVKKLKLCNTYYLQGMKCTSSHCTHRHDYPISNYERKVLREVARMTPCYYRTDCDDADCIYGHRCPQSKPGEPGCYYGEDCRFYGWGHGIDTRIVKTVKV